MEVYAGVKLYDPQVRSCILNLPCVPLGSVSGSESQVPPLYMRRRQPVASRCAVLSHVLTVVVRWIVSLHDRGKNIYFFARVSGRGPVWCIDPSA